MPQEMGGLEQIVKAWATKTNACRAQDQEVARCNYPKTATEMQLSALSGDPHPETDKSTGLCPWVPSKEIKTMAGLS